MGILPDRRAFVPFRGEEGGQASQTRVKPPLRTVTDRVVRPAKTAALRAGRRTEQYQATREVERLHGEATNVNAVPLPDGEEPLRRMSGFECLLVNGGTQLRDRRGEAAPAEPLLAAAYGANNAHAPIGAIDSNLNRGLEELIVESLLYGKGFKGEGAPRRLGEEWRKVNGIEGRQQRRRFALHELRLRRSASRGGGENGDDGCGHESVKRPAVAGNLADEPARG